jgi:hypothetical protein
MTPTGGCLFVGGERSARADQSRICGRSQARRRDGESLVPGSAQIDCRGAIVRIVQCLTAPATACGLPPPSPVGGLSCSSETAFFGQKRRLQSSAVSDRIVRKVGPIVRNVKYQTTALVLGQSWTQNWNEWTQNQTRGRKLLAFRLGGRCGRKIPTHFRAPTHLPLSIPPDATPGRHAGRHKRKKR